MRLKIFNKIKGVLTMSFIIKCSECDNEKVIVDKQSYVEGGINLSIDYSFYFDNDDVISITCSKCGHEIDFK